MSNRILGLCIPVIGRLRTIWGKLFFKIRVYFYGLVSRKEVLSESSHQIDTHLDVVVEFLEVQSSVTFEFCNGEDFIEFW